MLRISGIQASAKTPHWTSSVIVSEFVTEHSFSVDCTHEQESRHSSAAEEAGLHKLNFRDGSDVKIHISADANAYANTS